MKSHIAPLAGGIVILVSVLFWVIYMQTVITPLSGEWKKMFKAPAEELTAYAREHPLRLRNKKIQNEDISESTFVGAEFRNVVWDDVVAQDGRFVDATFSGGSMHDTSFAFSELKNVTFKQIAFTKSGFSKSRMMNVVFEDCQMDETAFVGAELINVTFRNCKIYNSEIRNLVNSKVSIVGSELSNVSFFQSLLQLKIRNSKVVEAIEFMGAQTGSSVDISDSEIGPYSDFGGSNFVSFEARNTKIDNSSANGITAKKVVLDNVVSDFAIAGSRLQEIVIRNLSGNFSLGRTKSVSTSIEGCQKNAEIYLNQFAGDRLSVRNCTADVFVLDAAIVKDVTLANLTVGELVLDSLKAGKLVLNNVLVNHKLSAQGAMAEEILAPNWRTAAGATIEAEGTNIPMPKPGP